MSRRSDFPRITTIALISVFVAVFVAEITKAAATAAILITVDQSGRGNFTKIQDAIDAVPVNNVEQVFIAVKPGIYREKVIVPANKPFITISGRRAVDTIVTWNDSRITYNSATLAVLASDFVGRYLTIQNGFGPGAQAVALRVSGDRVSFNACRFLGHQDTLLDDIGRHYYKSCYIEGATDFICGNAASLFENCHLHSVSDAVGTITAQRRESPSETTGFSFMGCKITGINSAVLGRPWGAYSRVVFGYTYMSDLILPQGWDDWQDPSKHSTVYYGQYRCYGKGANPSRRVPWSLTNMTSQEAAPFFNKSFIGAADWLRPLPTTFKRAFSSKP
ncbi:putative pectinesterase 11 [Momordica charantia]|uniref:pectinesterase n=1 Tax=Momordica charantia TaxID=3673 RepID=A0A6J1CQY5_MOMCH|nr:putative pectinesterase 11 [Momordica charantia]